MLCLSFLVLLFLSFCPSDRILALVDVFRALESNSPCAARSSVVQQ